jgi:septum formation protein
VPFACASPDVDERAVVGPEVGPRETAIQLARAKARAVLVLHPDAVVIGGDQVCALGDTVLHKPNDAPTTVDRLEQLAGRTHDLWTAICVAHAGGEIDILDHTRLTMRPLDRAALERYVAVDHPVGCAGGYKLEERGVALFERVETEDATAVVGIPLLALTRVLSELGYAIP